MTDESELDHVVVIGGGTMGAGIAVSLLVAGVRVSIVESSEEYVRSAHDRVVSSLGRISRRTPEVDVIGLLDRLDVRVDHPDDGVVLVIEAVPEDLALKRSVFESITTTYDRHVVLASNTSSLSISTIAEAVDRPERFVGMHFFNPVPVSALVEIVVGAGTDADTTAAAIGWVERIGKTAIVVDDSPGFASSRLGVALGMEAIRMLEEGVASAEDIDLAMELGYRHPMGPLRLTDLVGLDVRLAIADHLAKTLGDRFEPPALLRQMVDDGHLGKKTGRGFHEW